MGTTTYKLTNYINRIESCYSKAREDYNKAVDMMNRNEENHKRAISNGELSAKGIQNEQKRYHETKKKLLQQIAEIREGFTKRASEIRNSVNTLFRNNYRVTSNDIDLKAVEMLKRGMLTDTELLEMADIYKEQGNLSMYRYCGTFADADSPNPDVKRLAGDAKRIQTRTDLEVIDSFTDVCLKGLRDDTLLANGIDNRHEEFYCNSYSIAEDITATVTTPWDSE